MVNEWAVRENAMEAHVKFFWPCVGFVCCFVFFFFSLWVCIAGDVKMDLNSVLSVCLLKCGHNTLCLCIFRRVTICVQKKEISHRN